MTTCDRTHSATQRGFTLIEVIVVLAVLGVLLGTAVPLAGAVLQADRRQEARQELAALAAALDSYWFDNAAFPAALNTVGFFGVHLQPGVQDTVIEDPFGAGQGYRYQLDLVNNIAAVYSRGENGVDDGLLAEEFVVRVYAATPGLKKTWQRLRLIVELLADHIETGGSVVGAWPVVRAAAGMPAAFDRDGFGTTFTWTAATHTLTSAGPDRIAGNADDITL